MKDGSGDIIIKTTPEYDFDFITRSLGLIPINSNNAAINTGAIICIKQLDDGYSRIVLHSGIDFHLTPEEMAELEDLIKRRSIEAKALHKENVRDQILAQQEVVNELNRLAQPMPAIVGIPRKGRQ